MMVLCIAYSFILRKKNTHCPPPPRCHPSESWDPDPYFLNLDLSFRWDDNTEQISILSAELNSLHSPRKILRYLGLKRPSPPLGKTEGERACVQKLAVAVLGTAHIFSAI